MTKTMTEALAAIETSTVAPELRVLPRQVGEVAQQGDIYMHRVPDDHPRGKLLGTRQIAVGTTIGARHVVEGHVEVYEGRALPPWVTVPDGADESDLLGPVVVILSDAVLTHPEHAHHALQRGVEQVTYPYDHVVKASAQD